MNPEKASDPQKDNAAEDEQIEASATRAEEQAGGEEASTTQAEEQAGAERASARKRPRIRRKAAAKAGVETAPEEASGEEAAAKAPAGEPADAPAKKAAAKKAPARRRAGAESTAARPAASTGAKPAGRGGRRGGKPARRRVVRARARYVRTSARKARMVCVHLRGKTIPEARAILAFTPREVARDWSKLLESAVANAESNHELLEDDLIVREAYADEGPTIKRFRPRAMGRATPIQKRTSHLTITLITGP